MFRLRPHRVLYTNAVLGASAIHLLWATLISYEPSVLYTATAIGGIRLLLPDCVVVPALTGGAILAGLALFCRHQWRLLLLLPQAALLIMSDVGVFHAVSSGMFARGFAAPPAQIAADQAMIVFISLGYFITTILSLIV